MEEEGLKERKPEIGRIILDARKVRSRKDWKGMKEKRIGRRGKGGKAGKRGRRREASQPSSLPTGFTTRAKLVLPAHTIHHNPPQHNPS